MKSIKLKCFAGIMKKAAIAVTVLMVALSLNAQPGRGGKKPPIKKPATTTRQGAGVSRPGNTGGSRNTNVSNSGNRTNNIGSNNRKVNVDNSRKNVNINVDNSKNIRVNNNRNTVVRRNNNFRPYTRPPYRYGGFRYNCYRPYFYHPYRPFYWGPVWHPWGFFIATLTVTAIIIVVDADIPPPTHLEMPHYAGNFLELAEQRSGPYLAPENRVEEYYVEGTEYYYDQGVFYVKSEDGYTVVAAPIGATIKTMPDKYETVTLDDKTKNYYYGGTFYEKTDKGYTVVPPTAGTVVEHLPEGGEEVKMGEVTYVKVGETYYQPTQEGGKNVYEIADVEEDK